MTLWGLCTAGTRCWHVRHLGGQRGLPQAPLHPPRRVGIKLPTIEVHYEKLFVDPQERHPQLPLGTSLSFNPPSCKDSILAARFSPLTSPSSSITGSAQ
jgi:hypothetical protein